MKTLLKSLAFLAVFPWHSLTAATPQKPNIVLILADDLGYGDLGCYGATKIKTPNIDRLAQQGRRFTDAHAASSVCSPSRYALLTGEYPFRKNLWGPLFSASPLVLDPTRLTLASLLKRQGYTTSCFGKWHLGFGTEKPDWNKDLKPGPLEVGFDHYFGIPVVSSHSPYVLVEDHRVLGLDPADPLVYGGVPPTQPFPEKLTTPNSVSGGKAAHALYKDEELGPQLTEKATQWIRSQSKQEKPFFCYFPAPLIHHPFTPSPQFKGSSACGVYGDYVQEFDWIVGEVMRTLDELKIADNTLIIVTSDNGGMFNQGGAEAFKAGHHINGDLLGFKFDAWEGGQRIPFIARWPGRIEEASTSGQLIGLIDMLATFASLTGDKITKEEKIDSIDVLPALVSNPDHPLVDKMVLAPFKANCLTLRQGDWVYIGGQGGGGFPAKNPGDCSTALKITQEVNSDIENGRFKSDAPKAQLYNLKTDPNQKSNVILSYPEVAGRMQSELKEIVADAPIPRGN